MDENLIKELELSKDDNYKKLINNLEFSNKKLLNYSKRHIPVRCYLKIDLEEFFKNCKNLNYIVLRWFDNLPNVEKDEDIDILIDDNDYKLIEKYFTRRKRKYKFDIYRVYGRDYVNISYFEPRIAKIFLKNRILIKNLFWVPNDFNYFMSLLYHIVYHKAELSNIRINKMEEINKNDRYICELLKILKRNPNFKYRNINEYSLTYFHKILMENNLSPNIEYIRMYKRIFKEKKNSKKYNFLDNISSFKKDDRGIITIFVFRDKINKKFILESINEILNRGGEIVHIRESIKEFNNTRCNNYDKGPYKISGGYPKLIIIGFFNFINDNIKKLINISNQYQYKLIYDLKNFLRNKFIKDYNINTNILHTCDDLLETKYYLNIFGTKYKKFIFNRIDILYDKMKTKYKIIKNLTRHGNKSKIELIEFNDKLAIKKTFKFGRYKYLKNSLNIYKLELNNIPKLYLQEDNYLIIEYIKKNINFKLYNNYNKIINILRELYDKNYYHGDIHIENIILDKNNKIYLIDFENSEKYYNKPINFEQSLDYQRLKDYFFVDNKYYCAFCNFRTIRKYRILNHIKKNHL